MNMSPVVQAFITTFIDDIDREDWEAVFNYFYNYMNNSSKTYSNFMSVMSDVIPDFDDITYPVRFKIIEKKCVRILKDKKRPYSRIDLFMRLRTRLGLTQEQFVEASNNAAKQTGTQLVGY